MSAHVLRKENNNKILIFNALNIFKHIFFHSLNSLIMNGFLNFRSPGSRSKRFAVSAIFLLIAGVFTFFTFAGCEKDTSGNQGGTPEDQYLTPSCDNSCDECDAGRCYPKTVLDAVKDPGDETNDKINMILYHYAQAVRDAAKNPTYRQYMLNALTVNNEAKTASLLALAQGDASFANFINAKLRQSISEKNVYPRGVEPGIETLMTTATWDANTYLRNKIVYTPYSYDPVIYYMKKPGAGSENIAATVVIAQDVNDCDDVAGWRGDTELLVGETEATTSNDVIIFVGPGNPVDIGGQQVSSGTGGFIDIVQHGVQERAAARIAVSQFQVKNGYRYESSGKSEVRSWIVRFNPPGGTPFLQHNFMNFAEKIKKCEIEDSKNFTKSPVLQVLAIDPISGWLTNNAFMGFYENDWSLQTGIRRRWMQVVLQTMT